ncbi:hypothetical protein EVAR_103127_1 [Eumeta japonica]|uniref:Uncharacterized protein n=1 Tax=Eumeta variegata TaxID=151549 RepID=A0A4C1X5A9_EUMVA|nr:hypothetical protein EVAR_103127_1 [Eumeta japonica]
MGIIGGVLLGAPQSVRPGHLVVHKTTSLRLGLNGIRFGSNLKPRPNLGKRTKGSVDASDQLSFSDEKHSQTKSSTYFACFKRGRRYASTVV